MQSALVRIRMGEARIAIGHLERARRLSPRDPGTTQSSRDYRRPITWTADPETAYDWARRSVQHNPNYLPGWISLASSAAMTGREVEARMAAKHVLATRTCVYNPAGCKAFADQQPEKFAALHHDNASLRTARMTEQRRLAAILVADVVGYSKLVGSDEAGTLAQLQTLRTDIIEPAIAKHAGRLFKAVGDGFLVEFASAVQAVEAARAIQQANAEGELPLRIGIHVGDVVVQGDDLMGDGVNVAARIEARR